MTYLPRQRSRRITTLVTSLILVVLTAPAVAAQATPPGPAAQTSPRPLPIADYDRWRTIESTALSPDGEWLTFAYGHRVIEDTLQILNLSGDAVHEIPTGAEPTFSDDSRWVAYRLGTDGVGLLSLDTRQRTTWTAADRFAFAPGSSYLAVHTRPPAEEDQAEVGHTGTNLIVRDLARGVDLVLGNVADFAFNDTGALLAYTVDAADREGNGVYLLRLGSGVLATLDQAPLRYTRLTWDETGTALAALKGSDGEALTERANALVTFRGLDGPDPTTVEFDPAGADGSPAVTDGSPTGADGFPNRTVLSERGAISWKADLSMVFVGVKRQRAALIDDPEHPRANVDVFHWADDRLQTVQRAQAEADRNRTYPSAIDLDRGRFVVLADSTMRTVTLAEGGTWGVGLDGRAYVSDWKEPRADYYHVDTATGERTRFAEAQMRTLGLSPDGAHFAFWRDGDVWIYTAATGETRNLTASAPVSFVNEEYDHPGTKPPYGLAGWTADGEAMVLEHRYDLWLQPLDGSPATDLTGGFGSKEEVRLRVLDLDSEDDDDAIDLAEPVYLSAYGEWTKRSGVFELSAGTLTPLMFEDRELAHVQKASGADRFAFTSSTFAEFPDVYVAGARFGDRRKITDANPQQAEYRWGHRVLFEFENKDGVRLQGTLAIPDDYEPGEKLPMIVNFYEKKSQELHHYYAPLFESGYPAGNPGPVAELAAYVSHGYLVMQPDIHFNTGTTHSDMLDCVTAATRKVIEMGYADPDRIALVGGSFSGGGSAFIATQTDMFAAIAARAAPINLAGEFDILFGSGQNNHRYDIYGQGRYGTNPFDDFDLYRAQSPITHVRTMNTPLLYLHGKHDGSVEYLQGMEFYNALRFLGKPIIFLSYPDEGHNLHRYENQLDFTERLWQFLDHYLEDAPAPKWMTEGVPFLERGYPDP